MPTNFLIYKDRGGKMPQLRRTKWTCETHPYYIRYINNRPIAYHGPLNVIAENVTGDKVWCFDRLTFVPLTSLNAE